MIYSKDITKVCGVCRFFAADNDGGRCEKHKRAAEDISPACKKFVYDILKKPVHRKKKLKTEYTPDDFKL